MSKIDFKKEFAKKSSVNFRRRRFKNSPPDIVVNGGHYKLYSALTAKDICSVINGELTLEQLAKNLGCTNTKFAKFHVEYQLMITSDFYDPYELKEEAYILIATERKDND